MTTVILILTCIVTISYLLKVSMMSFRAQCVVAVVYAVFAWISMGRMTEVSHDMFTQLLASRPTRLNMGVCITLEAVVMMAWCFLSPLNSHPSRESTSKRQSQTPPFVPLPQQPQPHPQPQLTPPQQPLQRKKRRKSARTKQQLVSAHSSDELRLFRNFKRFTSYQGPQAPVTF